MNRNVSLIAVVFCWFNAQALLAASTEWQTLSLSDYGSDLDGHLSYALEGFEFGFIPMSGTVSADKLSLSFNEGGYMEFSNALVLSTFGVVNDEAYMRGQSSYHYLSESLYGDPTSTDYRTDSPLVIPKGEAVYVAVAGRNVLYTDEILYGWARLSVDFEGMLHLDNSALAPPGSYAVVGQSSIPEPSGGILFLLGAAALGLCRRRQDLRR